MQRQGSQKLKVLLVDDDVRVLGSLRRSLATLGGEVEFQVAHGGHEAISRSATNDFDLVISDLRMPNTDGEKVLGHLRRQQPDSVRVILSGQASAEKLLDTLRVSHQYLEKPCPTVRLAAVLDSLSVLKRSKLPGILLKQILTMSSLPCDGAMVSLVREQLSQEAAREQVDTLFTADLGMSIGLLRLLTIVSGGVVTEDEPLNAETVPSSLLAKFLDSHLLSPLFEADELLRAVRVTSIKANLLRQRLARQGARNHRLLGIVSYLGELALINSVGGDLEMLEKLHRCRDDITEVVWALWALPAPLLSSLHDQRFLALRQEIDAFFPLNDLAFLSNDEILEIFSEVVCLTD